MSARGALLVAFAAASLAGASPANGAEVPRDAVAMVGHAAITTRSFRHWLDIAKTSIATRTIATDNGVFPEPPDFSACVAHLEADTQHLARGRPRPSASDLKEQCEDQYRSLVQEVLGFLISATWVLETAREEHVTATPAEVTAKFRADRREEFHGVRPFRRFLARTHETVGDLMFRVEVTILSRRIQQRVLDRARRVGHAEIERYYDRNRHLFETPERRDARILLAESGPAAVAAAQEIRSGASFASVVARRSLDPSRAHGGLLRGLTRAQQESATVRAVFSARPHVLTGPVQTAVGWLVLRVERVKPAIRRALRRVEPVVRRHLVALRERGAVRRFDDQFEHLWISRTQCRAGYVVEECREYTGQRGGGGDDS